MRSALPSGGTVLGTRFFAVAEHEPSVYGHLRECDLGLLGKVKAVAGLVALNLMNIFQSIKKGLMLPIWVAQIATGAKSFADNPVIGSIRLNRLGLHRGRVRAAMAMTQWRRRRLAKRVRADWRESFDRDGFVAISNLLPPTEFESLRSGVLGFQGPAREMRQGGAITRRLAVSPEMLAAIPTLRDLLRRKDLKALFHYVSSYRVEPLHYVQAIVPSHGKQKPDPQEALHADAYHPSLKAWFFLNEVTATEAPFTYVPGSHKLTSARLEWEYRRSLRGPRDMDRLSARGSLRISLDEIEELGLPSPRALAVPANTLVVADTFGFHARGASAKPHERVEIWSYSRRNPFLPWLGGDLLSLNGLAERRIDWLWAARDRLRAVVGQPWKPVGTRRPVD